jgi:hypothetical protein
MEIQVTLNSKCRVEEAVDKFMTYHTQLLKEYGIEDVWADHAELSAQWHRLAACGRDEGGRQIMWVHGGGTAVAEERACIRSCCLYFFAVHADMHTLRNGISLVIDTSNAPKKKIGNEKKLQVAWQNYPTRPQGIYILGTTAVTRIFVNALIAFASLFAKNKVRAIRSRKVEDMCTCDNHSRVTEDCTHSCTGDRSDPILRHRGNDQKVWESISAAGTWR